MKLTTRNSTDLAQAAEVIATLDPKRKWRIEVTEDRKKRSSEQNRLLWAVYTAIANATGHTPEEVHEICKSMFLPPRVVAIAGKEVTIPPTTTDKDVPEFCEYVERVQSWAVTELGVQP